jgi:hypothetical protein
VEPHEERWLDYAWGVVACGDGHARACEAAGGIGMPGSSNARFPGFVGPEFLPGRGVLCMGHIHRYLPEADDTENGRLEAVESAAVSWLGRGRGPESDEEYLSDSTAAYLATAPTWDYWRRNYDPLLRKARVPIGEVAFANVAKCRTPTEDDSAASVRIAKLCAGEFPPAELIATLQPAAVLLASLRLDVGDVGDVRVIRWNGRTGVDEAGYRMSTWIEMEASKLHRLRTQA